MSREGIVKACQRCGKERPTNHKRDTKHCLDSSNIVVRAGRRSMAQGSCRSPQYSADWWWPEHTDPDDAASVAISICRYCPVRLSCLQYALEHREVHGIWGGLMPHQRAAMAAQRRKVAS